MEKLRVGLNHVVMETSITSRLLPLQKIEGRVSTDTDLKLTDLLRYYERDSKAALDLLYRRLRSMVDLENAKKTHEKAKIKGKDVPTVSGFEEFRGKPLFNCYMCEVGVFLRYVRILSNVCRQRRMKKSVRPE